MRVVFQQDEVGAGGMKLGFGRNPNSYMNKGIRESEDFREIYYRMYLKMQEGWEGNPAKLSRATVFTSSSDWSQAMIAHLWSDGNYHLLVDPVRCVDDAGNVKCIGYNDFSHMSWIGNKSGVTPIFDAEHDNAWYCVEAHIKLNDPGQSNGIQEFWIDGDLEARRDNLNFVGTYTDYAINAVFFENYWNLGSPKEQERYFDNIVVSTDSIGCLDHPSISRKNLRSGHEGPVISCYPNPFKTAVAISVSGINVGTHCNSSLRQNVEIYNTHGRLIHQCMIHNQNDHFTWNTAQYPNGIYLLRMEIGKTVYSKRLILIR
jgi:hypothetical protein